MLSCHVLELFAGKKMGFAFFKVYWRTKSILKISQLYKHDTMSGRFFLEFFER